MIRKGDKKLINAWCFYDWANSSYALVITTAIFPIYYASILGDKVTVFGTQLSTVTLQAFTLSIAFLIVSVLSPVLSGIADYSGNKKGFMVFFCYLGAISCGSLYFFTPESMPWCLLGMIGGSVGFWGSIVFYNSYLPEIAEPATHDRISAKGFSMGYVGSVLMLVIILVFVMFPELIYANIIDEIRQYALQHPEMDAESVHQEIKGPYQLQVMRYSFLMVAVWWIGFAQVTFRRLPNNVFRRKPTGNVVTKGFRELQKVWKEFMGHKRLKIFLLSFFIYSMAVQTMLQMAALFAAMEIKDVGPNGELVPMNPDNLIIILLIIQVIAILGAFLFSRASKRFGNIKVLGASLFIWVGVCLWANQVLMASSFYFLAAVVGLVMGGVQALSRSTYSKLLPETEDHASYFSFFDVLEKIGIVIGLVVLGFIANVPGGFRASTFFLAGLFLAGLVVLMFMPKTKHLDPTK